MELQRQLDLARGSLVYGRAARGGDPRHPCKTDACIRIIELRCVGDVERLRTEFEPAALGEHEVLEQGETHLSRATAVQDITSPIAADVLCRRAEATSVKPADDSARARVQFTGCDVLLIPRPG